MRGNSTDAEDAISRAMLKAWEKVQKHTANARAGDKNEIETSPPQSKILGGEGFNL